MIQLAVAANSTHGVGPNQNPPVVARLPKAPPRTLVKSTRTTPQAYGVRLGVTAAADRVGAAAPR